MLVYAVLFFFIQILSIILSFFFLFSHLSSFMLGIFPSRQCYATYTQFFFLMTIFFSFLKIVIHFDNAKAEKYEETENGKKRKTIACHFHKSVKAFRCDKKLIECGERAKSKMTTSAENLKCLVHLLTNLFVQTSK